MPGFKNMPSVLHPFVPSILSRSRLPTEAPLQASSGSVKQRQNVSTQRFLQGPGWSPWMSSVELARQLEGWMQRSSDLALLVGGADGLDQGCIEQADQLWSLSPLTFPHALIRVIVAEQLYRAWSLLNHHPYHRR
jgi:23S rRNA pseudoU1915 N3-methylase RlmH